MRRRGACHSCTRGGTSAWRKAGLYRTLPPQPQAQQSHVDGKGQTRQPNAGTDAAGLAVSTVPGESLWHMRSRNKRAEGGDWGVSQWLRSLVVAALHLLVLPPFLLLTTTAAAMARAVVTAATGVIAAATGIGRTFALWHDCVGFFVTQAQAE